jgi:hypothetical protein
MSCLAVKFDEEDARTSLSETFGVDGIPSLQVIGKDGKLITDDGRTLMVKQKFEAIKTWCGADEFSTSEDF